MSYLSILGDTADFGQDKKKERFLLLPLLSSARNWTRGMRYIENFKQHPWTRSILSIQMCRNDDRRLCWGIFWLLCLFSSPNYRTNQVGYDFLRWHSPYFPGIAADADTATQIHRISTNHYVLNLTNLRTGGSRGHTCRRSGSNLLYWNRMRQD
jgi:hypothetical protein